MRYRAEPSARHFEQPRLKVRRESEVIRMISSRGPSQVSVCCRRGPVPPSGRLRGEDHHAVEDLGPMKYRAPSLRDMVKPRRMMPSSSSELVVGSNRAARTAARWSSS